MVTRRLSTALAVGFIAALTACGGGSGSEGSPSPSNQPPVADPGSAQAVNAFQDVLLDGTGSTDPDGVVSTYLWQQVSGPALTLANADTPQASFTAPDIPAGATLVFSLTVTDDEGARSSSNVAITVNATQVLQRFSLTGTVDASTNQVRDGDTNDPTDPVESNNSPGSAQRISNPVTVGGYVNQPGTGSEGAFHSAGDIDDYYRVELLAGQSVTLLVADYQTADADLYLLDTNGAVLDFSIDVGEVETLEISADGTYLVNVFAFEGATNYTLAVGSRPPGINANPRAEVIPWETVVAFRDPRPQPSLATSRRQQIMDRVGMIKRSGDWEGPNLLAMHSEASDFDQSLQRLGTALQRKGMIIDHALSARWETLMTIKSLRRDPQITHAEPNYRVHAYASTNDEAYPFQWHYPLINLPAAWDTTTGASEVIVAVIDTGILSRHPDLDGQLVPGFDFIRSASSSADGDGIDPDPEEPATGSGISGNNFHGTHVAGTVAARGNNGIGVVGVAYSARVMPIRALGIDGSGTSYDLNQAIRYAAALPNDSGTVPEQAADVINLSLGGAGFSEVDQALFRELSAAGILVVAAAGNDGSSIASYPAAYDGVFSVSAVDAQGQITRYSNRGNTIDIAAPGGDASADFNGDGYPDGVLSTGGSNTDFAYTFLSGTSMAAPHVAGVFALMKSVNAALGASDIEALLSRGDITDDVGTPGPDSNYGYGIINAQRAVDAALNLAGEDNPAVAAITANTNLISFGGAITNLTLGISRAGSGSLQVTRITGSEPWLTISPAEVDTDGLGLYNVTIDRGLLSDGVNSGEITVFSSENTLKVSVLATGGDAAVSDLGRIYILLIDDATEEVVAEASALPRGGNYAFDFGEVPAGTYQIYAGTDLDNDFTICDSGEACGAWLTIDQPQRIELTTDRDNIDFAIEYLVVIPTIASAGNTEPTLLRSRRPLGNN
ncbi:MAG: S8 family serine peptidase [Halioglobus sp.]